MATSYYRLLYRLDGRSALLIWLSNERDGVLVKDGRVLSFESEELLRRFAAQAAIELVDEPPALHDLDSVQAWVLRPRRETIDCSASLDAWNLFGDVARSLPVAGADFAELDRAHGQIYEKLFLGCNLAAITPAGARHEPEWSGEEMAALAATLGRGLELFRLLRQEVTA